MAGTRTQGLHSEYLFDVPGSHFGTQEGGAQHPRDMDSTQGLEVPSPAAGVAAATMGTAHGTQQALRDRQICMLLGMDASGIGTTADSTVTGLRRARHPMTVPAEAGEVEDRRSWVPALAGREDSNLLLALQGGNAGVVPGWVNQGHAAGPRTNWDLGTSAGFSLRRLQLQGSSGTNPQHQQSLEPLGTNMGLGFTLPSSTFVPNNLELAAGHAAEAVLPQAPVLTTGSGFQDMVAGPEAFQRALQTVPGGTLGKRSWRNWDVLPTFALEESRFDATPPLPRIGQCPPQYQHMQGVLGWQGSTLTDRLEAEASMPRVTGSYPATQSGRSISMLEQVPADPTLLGAWGYPALADEEFLKLGRIAQSYRSLRYLEASGAMGPAAAQTMACTLSPDLHSQIHQGQSMSMGSRLGPMGTTLFATRAHSGSQSVLQSIGQLSKCPDLSRSLALLEGFTGTNALAPSVESGSVTEHLDATAKQVLMEKIESEKIVSAGFPLASSQQQNNEGRIRQMLATAQETFTTTGGYSRSVGSTAQVEPSWHKASLLPPVTLKDPSESTEQGDAGHRELAFAQLARQRFSLMESQHEHRLAYLGMEDRNNEQAARTLDFAERGAHRPSEVWMAQEEGIGMGLETAQGHDLDAMFGIDRMGQFRHVVGKGVPDGKITGPSLLLGQPADTSASLTQRSRISLADVHAPEGEFRVRQGVLVGAAHDKIATTDEVDAGHSGPDTLPMIAQGGKIIEAFSPQLPMLHRRDEAEGAAAEDDVEAKQEPFAPQEDGLNLQDGKLEPDWIREKSATKKQKVDGREKVIGSHEHERRDIEEMQRWETADGRKRNSQAGKSRGKSPLGTQTKYERERRRRERMSAAFSQLRSVVECHGDLASVVQSAVDLIDDQKAEQGHQQSSAQEGSSPRAWCDGVQLGVRKENRQW